ncbi:MAG: hypothetical protein WC455_28950, partial [Dehalococcoidia bacterium]
MVGNKTGGKLLRVTERDAKTSRSRPAPDLPRPPAPLFSLVTRGGVCGRLRAPRPRGRACGHARPRCGAG